MKNEKLPYPSFLFKTWIILVITFRSLVSTLTCLGQEFVNDWEAYSEGPQTSHPRQLAVNVDNGDSYVIQTEFGHAPDFESHWGVVKYDKNGHPVWRVTYSGDEPAQPRSLVYKNGAVFVLGSILNRAVVVKFIDNGDSASQSWARQFSLTHSGTCTVNAIVSDPVGSGVIFVGSAIGATIPDHVEMTIIKMDGGVGLQMWANFYDLGVDMDPHPEPVIMTTDPLGNIYVAGALADLPAVPDYVGPTSLFTIKYNSDGFFQWINKLTERGYSNYGYDVEADETGVYVLGQKSYVVPMLERRSTGFVTLTKFDLRGTDDPLWNLQIPGLVRQLEFEREALAVDRASSSVYIAYNGEEPNVVNVQKYSADGILQWTREIEGSEAHVKVQSVNLDRNGNVIIGVNRGSLITNYTLYAYTAAGDFIDEITRLRNQTRNLVVDNDNRIHVMGNLFGPSTPLSKFVSQFSFTEPNPPLPDVVRQFERLEVDLFRHGYEECWTGLRINWPCFRPPFCSDPLVYVGMSNNDKLVWESKFTKPLEAQLPQTQDFRTFSLQVMDGQSYTEVLHIDDNLAKAGLSQISLLTDSKDLSLSLQMETNGVEVPVTISFLNKKGAVIKEQKFIAPFKEIFSEKLGEKVASISLTGQAVMSLSYYPNPSSGQFKVLLDKAIKLPAELSIFDMQGLKIYNDTLTAYDASVVLGKPKVGLYILQVKSGEAIRRDLIQIK